MSGWRSSKCVWIPRGSWIQYLIEFSFQESPFKLDVIGKDFYDASIVSIDFLASEGSMTFSAADDQGDLRLLEFDPQRRLLVSEALF